MTTASITARNVALMNPVVSISRSASGEIMSHTTATEFVDSNFRHLINRRMKNTAPFVFLALGTLVREIVGQKTGDSIYREMAEVEDLVRRAANRRKAWSDVSFDIVNAVEDLILACIRIL